jgi:hypothetical protein
VHQDIPTPAYDPYENRSTTRQINSQQSGPELIGPAKTLINCCPGAWAPGKKMKRMKNYESLVDALADLKQRGYETDFEVETFCLYCSDLDIRLNPEAFHVDEFYRFEGDSNPDDSAVLYAITSDTGVRGTLVDGYGASSSNVSFEMARKLRSHHSTADVAMPTLNN